MFSDVLTDEELKNLEHYKYSSIDLSPIANYILQPYWRWATTLFPLWIAPNLITLLGFMFIVANFILVMIYIPDLETPAPSWLYVSFAFAIWMYSTFDNVDGKQARRTNSSSPLGEVFDHGVDALNCSTAAVLQAATIGLGFGLESSVLVCLATTNFFFSTWETYYTSTLFLGYVNGPTEGILIAIFTMLMTAIYGTDIWKIPASAYLGEFANLLSFRGEEPHLAEFGTFVMFLLLVATQLPISVYRALEACKRKGKSQIAAILNVIPYLTMMSGFMLWIYAPRSIAHVEGGFPIYISFSIAVGRICALLVVKHVTHSDYPTYYFLVWPYVLGAIIAWLPEFTSITIFTRERELIYIYLMLGLFAIEYVIYIQAVIRQFCEHLGIECMRIPYAKTEEIVADHSPKRTRNKINFQTDSPSSRTRSKVKIQ